MKSLSAEKILAEIIQAGGRQIVLRSIKRINFTRDKEEWSQVWSQSL